MGLKPIIALDRPINKLYNKNLSKKHKALELRSYSFELIPFDR